MPTTMAADPKRKRAPVDSATAEVKQAKKARVVGAVVRVDTDGTVLGSTPAAAAAQELGVHKGLGKVSEAD